ncbi:diacylglycerol kinase family protein [Psychroflexus sp. CAK57W]|uniref:diacylglycerol kinase family protein n=1 Tax=Psychroflexus curvus TaxID=2873595 RepID=UPI001CCAD1F6|nr:diacylglycerol kinase family protein [Psychroflexus curvus]MBZ9628645.1 diacylglycerol kinase family protein [Psychroflexus curvus]MBZ9787909.1 diacylglycerol kinase family protein [Psychroflexus curvus]
MFQLKTIKERLKSFVYAFRGLSYLVSKEDSFKFQLLFSAVFIFAGFYFEISTSEWFAQLGMMALVLSAESLNSAIEQLADYIQPKHDKAIGKIKDISAGAVLVSGIFAFVIGLIIYIPHILALI